MKTFSFTAAHGVPFTVRVVLLGDRYGLNNCLTHEKEEDPLVEFYDARYPHTEHGQFVSRYYASTLCEGRSRLERVGLCLDGGIPAWSVDSFSMRRVFDFLHGALPEGAQ